MRMKYMFMGGAALLLGLGFTVSSTGNAFASSCGGTVGVSCGSQAATDGVVTGAAQWISTNGGLTGVGSLGVGGETNGSTYTSNPFTAAANDILSYNFNYVTSDGSGYEDYAW